MTDPNDPFDGRKVHRGYTRHELSDAFDMIKSSKGWKFPIRAVIAETDRDIVNASIEFFAGGGAQFNQVTRGTLLVTAPGYYNLIGS